MGECISKVPRDINVEVDMFTGLPKEFLEKEGVVLCLAVIGQNPEVWLVRMSGLAVKELWCSAI